MLQFPKKASAHVEPGREGLFGLIRSLPEGLRYERGPESKSGMPMFGDRFPA